MQEITGHERGDHRHGAARRARAGARSRSHHRYPCGDVRADSSGKLDLNNTGVQALADRLRDPLQAAGVSLSEQQLQDLANNIKTFRDTPPRSGLFCAVSTSCRVFRV